MSPISTLHTLHTLQTDSKKKEKNVLLLPPTSTLATLEAFLALAVSCNAACCMWHVASCKRISSSSSSHFAFAPCGSMNCDRIPLVAVVAANVARCKLQLYHDEAENAIATLHVMLPLPHAAAHAATRWNAAVAVGKGGRRRGGGLGWYVPQTIGGASFSLAKLNYGQKDLYRRF